MKRIRIENIDLLSSEQEKTLIKDLKDKYGLEFCMDYIDNTTWVGTQYENFNIITKTKIYTPRRKK